MFGSRVVTAELQTTRDSNIYAVGVHAVTGGVDVRIPGGLQLGGDPDAVVHLESGGLGEFGRRADADPDEHRVRGDLIAAAGHHDGSGPDLLQADAEAEVDVVIAVQLGEHAADVR